MSHFGRSMVLLGLWIPCSVPQSEPLQGAEGRVKFSTTVYETIFGTTAVISHGLRGEVFHISPKSWKLPNFSKLKPVGVVYAESLNIPPRDFSEGFPGVTERNEFFAINYTGKFYVEAPGKYEFFLTSDDGARLYIDGKEIIDNDGEHPPKDASGSVKLKTGVHSIRLAYFQGPRFHIALVLSIRTPRERRWRTFNLADFKVPPGAVVDER